MLQKRKDPLQRIIKMSFLRQIFQRGKISFALPHQTLSKEPPMQDDSEISAHFSCAEIRYTKRHFQDGNHGVETPINAAWGRES